MDEDGQDPTARADITQLLCQLRDRPDVTYRTRSDVEGVLASLGDPAPVYAGPASVGLGHDTTGPVPTGPVPMGPVQQPMGAWPQPMGPPMQPPAGPGGGWSPRSPGGPGGSRAKWLLAAGGGAVALALVVGLVVWLSGSGTKPTPPKPPPVLATGQLPSVLLTASEVDAIMGTTNIQPDTIFERMAAEPPSLSDPSCLGAFQTGDATVYQGSGFTGVRRQRLEAKNGEDRTDLVFQTAVTFPSAEQANAFLTASADKWAACAGQTVTRTDGDKTYNWTFGDLTRTDAHIAQSKTYEGGSGWACQHALRTTSNVVVEALACNDHIGDEATRVTDKIVAKVEEQLAV